MKFRDKVRLIDTLYRRLEAAMDPHSSVTHGNYITAIYKLERQAERDHRNFTGHSSRYQITQALAARLQTVQWICAYMLEPHKAIKPRDVLDCRLSVLMAAGVVDRYENTIAETISEAEGRQFLDEIDYGEMVRGR